MCLNNLHNKSIVFVLAWENVVFQSCQSKYMYIVPYVASESVILSFYYFIVFIVSL